tara:strand:- start:2810 stop:4039 length:1230 start_codon:yes stop_codon:yes gene_type:complete
VRVAIVGSGISGLFVARALYPLHEVTLFEARDRIGGHVNTLRVEDDSGEWSVDTGFIVYNERNYPLFTRLLRDLEVPTQPSNMSFSVRSDRSGLEYNGSTVSQLFVQKRNLLRLGHYRMIRDILRFNREAHEAIAKEAGGVSLGEYIELGKYSVHFVQHYLIPMGSALWSMPPQRVLEMPAEFFVNFFRNHGMLSVNDRPEWRVVCGGSKRYVEALIRPFRDRIRTSSPVISVRRNADQVLVNGESFDQVVLACHSNQALDVLEDATYAEHEVLGSLTYQMNKVVVHTDESVLPHRKAAWGSWNYYVAEQEESPAVVTYNMNLLQTLRAPKTFCVTLNPAQDIDPKAVLYKTSYSHPLYTREAISAQKRHEEISGRNRTHYCGAYWGYGFHEDGIFSANRVAAFIERRC